MLKSAKMVAVAVLAALVPTLSHAAVATFGYGTLQTATNSTFTAGLTSVALSGNATSGYAATIPAGVYVRYALNVVVTGNANPAASSAYNANVAQPANLGLGSFGQNVTIAPGATSFAPIGAIGAAATNSINSQFDVKGKGTIAANAINNISGGVLAGANIDGSDSSTFGKATIGVGAGSNVYTGLSYYDGTTGGTAVLSSAIAQGNVAFVTNQTQGDAATPPTYTTTIANGTTFTYTGPGTLTLTVTAAPEPASLAMVGLGGLSLLRRRRQV